MDAPATDPSAGGRAGERPSTPDWAFGTPAGQTQAHLNFIQIKNVDDLNHAPAQAKGKPVMLDLYADWCVACKEFEKYTFSDPQVQHALSDTVLLGRTLPPTARRIRLY